MTPNQPSDKKQPKDEQGKDMKATNQARQPGSQQSQQPGSQQKDKQQQPNQKPGSQQQGQQPGSQQSGQPGRQGGQHASGGTPALDELNSRERGETARQAGEAFKQPGGKSDKR